MERIKIINFNTYRHKLTGSDIHEIYELLNKGLRQKNKDLLAKRLDDHLALIPYHGILERLMKDKHGWSYCAGQSYTDEIRTVRNIILTLK